jgi:hypothetical protein
VRERDPDRRRDRAIAAGYPEHVAIARGLIEPPKELVFALQFDDPCGREPSPYGRSDVGARSRRRIHDDGQRATSTVGGTPPPIVARRHCV